MGATFPVLSEFFISHSDHFSHRLGKLYGINLLGAMVGALSTGFFFIPLFGVKKTIYLAVLIEFTIFSWVFLTAKKIEKSSPIKEKLLPNNYSLPPKDIWIKIIIILSGACALIYEIAWMRIINLLIGSSIYAFTLLLAAYLGGLGVGSFFFSRKFDHQKDLFLLLGLLQIGIGGAALSLTPFFEKLSLLMVPFFNQFSHNFILLQALEFFGLFMILLVPSAMLGMLFPLFCKIEIKNFKSFGSAVGTVYLVNGLGAVLGIILSSLLLIPWIGLQKTVLFAVAINVLIGSFMLLFSSSLSLIKKSLAVPLIIGATIFFFFAQPQWNNSLMSAGSYLYSRIYSNAKNRMGNTLTEAMKNLGDLLFYEEDVQTTVSVRKGHNNQLFIQLDGKTDASSKNDSLIQLLIAHVPMLLHANPKKAMVLGLGSGMSLAAAEKYTADHLDCLEISPGVIKASDYFKRENNNILDNPKIKVLKRDGREHLLLTNEKYDVIISQPSNPWVAGMSGLLTQEFFQICSNRLNENGLCVTWLQTFNISLNNIKSVLKAFQTVFPYLSLWEAKPGVDYFLIGCKDKIQIDLPNLQKKMSEKEELHSEFKFIGLETANDLISYFIMNEDGVINFANESMVHTDDNSFLEFQTPKALYKETMALQLEAFNNLRGKGIESLLTDYKEHKETLTRIFEAQKHYALSEMYFLKNQKEEGLEQIREAYKINPSCSRIKTNYYNLALNYANNLRQQGMLPLAIQAFSSVIQVDPKKAEGYLRLGLAYFAVNHIQAAIYQFQKVLEIEPNNPLAHINLGAAYLRSGNLEGAILENRSALRLNPDQPEAHFNLGIAYARSGMIDQAIPEYQQAIKMRPDHAEAHFNLGICYQRKGALDLAISEYQEALRLKPDFSNARNLLDQLQRN